MPLLCTPLYALWLVATYPYLLRTALAWPLFWHRLMLQAAATDPMLGPVCLNDFRIFLADNDHISCWEAFS